MIKKNDDFDLTITGYTSEGSGVGKKDGIAVFVENTAKNDVIKCHVIKAKKNYAIGKAMKIIKPSTFLSSSTSTSQFFSVSPFITTQTISSFVLKAFLK